MRPQSPIRPWLEFSHHKRPGDGCTHYCSTRAYMESTYIAFAPRGHWAEPGASHNILWVGEPTPCIMGLQGVDTSSYSIDTASAASVTCSPGSGRLRTTRVFFGHVAPGPPSGETKGEKRKGTGLLWEAKGGHRLLFRLRRLRCPAHVRAPSGRIAAGGGSSVSGDEGASASFAVGVRRVVSWRAAEAIEGVSTPFSDGGFSHEPWEPAGNKLPALIWNDRRQVVIGGFLHRSFPVLQLTDFLVRRAGRVASTTSHSDIRGLPRLAGAEPTVPCFVGKYRCLRSRIRKTHLSFLSLRAAAADSCRARRRLRTVWLRSVLIPPGPCPTPSAGPPCVRDGLAGPPRGQGA